MSSDYSDASKTARALRKIRYIEFREGQEFFEGEEDFVRIARRILTGRMPYSQDIKIEDPDLLSIAENLWHAYADDGPPEFWQIYDELAERYPRLNEWRWNIDPLLFPYEDEDEVVEQLGVLLSRVTPHVVEWLWKLIIALGKLTLLDGDPGTGKSLLLCDIAARLTRGWQMPDGTPGMRGGVVIIAPEDELGDTIQPRLARAGADLSQIVCLNLIQEKNRDGEVISNRPFVLPRDLDVLEEAIEQVQAKLVILDPLMAVLGRRGASHDGDIRQMMTPLQLLMQRLNVACVMVRHLTKKASENMLYRGSGSIAFLALARSCLLAMHDPEDETRQVLVPVKSNLGPLGQSLAYRISDDRDKEDERPHILWEGPSPITARHLCSPASMLATLGAGRQAILNVLSEHGEAGLTPQQIAEKLPEMDARNIRMTLKRMAASGQISQLQRGVYAVPSA